MSTILLPPGPHRGAHAPDRVALEDYLNGEYPGGRYLLAHLDDGPWHEVLVSSVLEDSPAWAILAGWPGHVVHVFDYRHNRSRDMTVYTLPSLAYQLLKFAPIVGEIRIVFAQDLPGCAGERTESEIIARYFHYGCWDPGGPLPALCAVLAGRASLAEVAAFCRTLPGSVLANDAKAEVEFAAFAAALTGPRP